MALVTSARKEGVSVDGKRTVQFTCAFSDGSAADLTKAVIGLQTVDRVYVLAATSGGSGIDVTANDATKLTLDPVAAVTATMVFVGS